MYIYIYIGGWSKRLFSEMCQKSQITGGPLEQFTSASCVLLSLFTGDQTEENQRINVTFRSEHRYLAALSTSLGWEGLRATVWFFCHAQQTSPLVCASSMLYLWSSLDLFGTSLKLFEPYSLVLPQILGILSFDINPANVSSLQKCHGKCLISGLGLVLPHVR